LTPDASKVQVQDDGDEDEDEDEDAWTSLDRATLILNKLAAQGKARPMIAVKCFSQKLHTGQMSCIEALKVTDVCFAWRQTPVVEAWAK
jgi:hypothetical protein